MQWCNLFSSVTSLGVLSEIQLMIPFLFAFSERLGSLIDLKGSKYMHGHHLWTAGNVCNSSLMNVEHSVAGPVHCTVTMEDKLSRVRLSSFKSLSIHFSFYKLEELYNCQSYTRSGFAPYSLSPDSQPDFYLLKLFWMPWGENYLKDSEAV